MDFQSIESEKAKAMASYNRLQNIAKFRRLIELVVVAVLLISSLSSAGEITGKSLSVAGENLSLAVKSLSLAYNPLVSFVLFNSIIAVLVLLSRQNHGGDGAGDDGEDLRMPVFSDSDFEIPSPRLPEVTPLPEASPPPQPEEEETAAAAAPEEREKQVVVVEERNEAEAVTVAIETAKKQIRRFERTQSAILKRDLTPRHRFRRSETERAMSVTDKAETERERAISVIDKVESLSNEEFQRTVDEFIAKQQRALLAQKLAEKKLV